METHGDQRKRAGILHVLETAKGCKSFQPFCEHGTALGHVLRSLLVVA